MCEWLVAGVHEHRGRSRREILALWEDRPREMSYQQEQVARLLTTEDFRMVRWVHPVFVDGEPGQIPVWEN